jgi:hypothetical protein
MTSALVGFRWLAGGITALNAKTIFEQVLLGDIKKIIKRGRTTKRTQRIKKERRNLTNYTEVSEGLTQENSHFA